MKTSKFFVIIHSNIEKYDKTVKKVKKGFRLTNISNERYLFSDANTLLKNINLLSTPPILKEDPITINLLDIYNPVIFLDSTVQNIGIVNFKEFNMDLYLYYKDSKFVCERFYLEKNGFFGKNTEFTLALNTFLKTLPIVTVRQFLIAFAKSLESYNMDIVNDFLENNRLITENKKELSNLEDKINKKNIKCIKKLINKYGHKDLNTDKEGNMLC